MRKNSAADHKVNQKTFFDIKYQRRGREKELLFDFYIHHYALSYGKLVEAFNELDIGDDSLVLDIGCGDRPLSYIYATNSHCLVVGVDLSRPGLRTARSNATKIFAGSFEPIIADLDRLPFRSNCFDAVVHSMVLEHVTNPKLGLTEASRVLKRGGKIFVYTVNKRYWLRRIFKVISPSYLKAMRHSEDLFYDIEAIKEMFKENCLCLESKTFLFVFVTAVWDLLLLPKLLKIGLSKSWLVMLYRRILLPLLQKIATILDSPMRSIGHSSCLVAVGKKIN